MSPTIIAILVGACVLLLAALIATSRIGNLTTQKLVILALMIALFVLLSLSFLTLRLGWIKITPNALPIIIASLLYGPLEGMLVGLLGAFLEQMLTYGVTATTALWILPAAARGLLIGWYAKKKGFALSAKQLSFIIILSSIVVTTLNTGAIYLDSVIYGYYSYAYVFGAVGTRYASGIATAVVMVLITPPVLKLLHRSLASLKTA